VGQGGARFVCSSIALGTVAWIRIAKLYDELTAAIDSGQQSRAIKIMERLLDVA
jgi:hypothetical protein